VVSIGQVEPRESTVEPQDDVAAVSLKHRAIACQQTKVVREIAKWEKTIDRLVLPLEKELAAAMGEPRHQRVLIIRPR
jgi:hypothetical protein